MLQMTIRLPDETVNYLQRLDYEIAGLQVLHTHALKTGVPLEKRIAALTARIAALEAKQTDGA